MKPSLPEFPTRRMTRQRAMSLSSTIGSQTTDGYSSHTRSSTPPTSIGDNTSDSTSLDVAQIQAGSIIWNSRRTSERIRRNICPDNTNMLNETAIQGSKKGCNVSENPERRRTISGDATIRPDFSSTSKTPVQTKQTAYDSKTMGTLNSQAPPIGKFPVSAETRDTNGTSQNTRTIRETIERKLTRSSAQGIPRITRKSVTSEKRKNCFDRDLDSLVLAAGNRELRKLADTNEYAKIDTEPVIHEVWSNGKLVTSERPVKKRRVENSHVSSKSPERTEMLDVGQGKKRKFWLSEGLYAGQDYCQGWLKNSTSTRKDSYSVTPSKLSKIFPLPIWHGQRVLEIGREFKLPFDVCSPLPPGQPKPDEWRKTTKNRFVGEASALWKVSKFFDSSSSKCVCKPETGCGEDCQNRIMFYECDDTNCASRPGRCTNRAFAELQERLKAGGKYRIGVEVIKTADRGYGVRSNRCFEPQQIIVEYTGEIITEDECDRRMNEDYKNNESMIIDATKGSIARFVNHSCKPNCLMVKWIVGGNPRMALFAGDEPIMTGDELTYDYNFDPFSAKNIQECRCGSDNCRGVLGPRPKDMKQVKESIKDSVKPPVKTGRRKPKQTSGSYDSGDARSPQKDNLKSDICNKSSTSSTSSASRESVINFQNSVSVKFLRTRRSVASKRVIVKTRHANSFQLKTTGDRQTEISSLNSSLNPCARNKNNGLSGLEKKALKIGKNNLKKRLFESLRSRGRSLRIKG